MTEHVHTLGLIGGTGTLGMALARRWARAGHRVVIGSRNIAKAQAAAADLSGKLAVELIGTSNILAAQQTDIVIMTIPWNAHEAALNEIRAGVQGKIVIDTTVPLMPPKVMRVQLPTAGSAAVHSQTLLGPDVRVVAAYHNVAAHKLATDEEVDCDILVFGDDKAARQTVISLVKDSQLRGLHGGALVNSAAAEALTSVLIFLNRCYDVDGAGIRITGRLKTDVQ